MFIGSEEYKPDLSGEVENFFEKAIELVGQKGVISVAQMWQFWKEYPYEGFHVLFFAYLRKYIIPQGSREGDGDMVSHFNSSM